MSLQVTPNQTAAVLVAKLLAANPGLTIVPGSEEITVVPVDLTMVSGATTYGPPPSGGTSVSSGLFSGGLALPYNPATWGIDPDTTEGLRWDEGVILSTGWAIDSIGPNDSTGSEGSKNLLTDLATGPFTPPKVGTPGDDDIQAIVDTYPTGLHKCFDACALEFDFIPSGNQIYFEYAFASNEYNEYVGSQYNDLMLIMLDGVNIALLPGTSTKVSINTVNASSASDYFEFSISTTSGVISYDGLVGGLGGPALKSLLYALVGVTPGVSHHIKFVVCDVNDAIQDSALFLGANTFTSMDLTITTTAEKNVLLSSGTDLSAVVGFSQSATYQWEKVNGPGDVTFTTPTSLSTHVSFTKNGKYVIRIVATIPSLSLVLADYSVLTVMDLEALPTDDPVV